MNEAYTNDTIAAISTASGKAGIGIVRISGHEAYRILTEIFAPVGGVEMESHMLRYGHVTENGGIVDEVMAVYMKAPRTYTREDVVEINCHGGHASVTRVLELVLKRGARLAENGEFTRRAFMNGRIDLSQAEAVMELVNAQTEMSARAAMLRLGGRLGEVVKRLSGEILTLLANIEVSIDYPEHEMETKNQLLIKEKSIAVLTEIEKLIATSETGRILNTGIEAVIAGRPNVGKSSVLNAFLKEDRAIVTDVPGTTRDLISEFINLQGVPLKLTDTAGIRDSADDIEAMGVERSRKKLTSADLVLFVIDGAAQLSKQDIDLYQTIKNIKHVILINKSDLPSVADIEPLKENPENIFEISALKAYGLEPVYERIRSMFISGDIEPNSDVMISGLRSKNALLNAAAALREALSGMECGLTQDLFSIDLRDCYNYLGEITGETLDDKLLDKIFSEFCLGK